MKSKKKDKSDEGGVPSRIVIKFRDSLQIPYQNEAQLQAYFSKNNLISWRELIKRFQGIKITKLYTSVTSGQIIKLVTKLKELNPEYSPSNFLNHCAIDCPYKITNIDELLSELLAHEIVEIAYIESDPIPPICTITGQNPMMVNQGYLNSSPEGIDAKYAWKIKGGCGEGKVQFIDIEPGWNLNHEDLKGAGVVLLNSGINKSDWFGHGTAVLGTLLMQDNNFGGVGITPKAKGTLIPQISQSGHNIINDAIMKAIDMLNYGDILLLEAQVTETDFPRKQWPVEIRQMTFDVIELATAKGIIVIEPAGNGSFDDRQGNNLDDFIDRNNKRILDRTSLDFKDSGAIMVAAASDSAAHGRRRFSNYGNRIDCFAWGSNVFTTDDPLSAANPLFPYNSNFGGTSSASAIIAGVAIAVQSILESSGRSRLSPKEMRDLLSNNGISSRSTIGIMPDLKRIIDKVIPGLRP